MTRAATMAPALAGDQPVAIAGVAGALDADLRPGDLVVASELRTVDGEMVRRLPGADLLAAELLRAGCRVRIGPVVSSSSLVRSPGARRALASTGALCVDMESAFIAQELAEQPMAVVRAVADTTDIGLIAWWDPSAAGAPTGPRYRSTDGVGRSGHARSSWRRPDPSAPGSTGPSRSSSAPWSASARRCTSGARSCTTRTSYARLEALGAVFVLELDDVPDGAVVVLAAHGVSPEVRAEAATRRTLTVIDATCPLVAKVHHEARRFASQAFSMVLIGHADHEEVAGTIGEAPERIRVVQDVSDVGGVALRPRRAPGLPDSDDTGHRRDPGDRRGAARSAIRRSSGRTATTSATPPRTARTRCAPWRCVATWCWLSDRPTRRTPPASWRWRDARAVVASSSRTPRSCGCDWLDGARVVGVTAGASAPESLVQQVLDALAPLGPLTVDEYRTTEETVRFSLPQQVR